MKLYVYCYTKYMADQKHLYSQEGSKSNQINKLNFILAQNISKG
jgi:hypothetical protein